MHVKELGREDRANRAWINTSIRVPTCSLIDGTYVQTSRAADASEALPTDFVGKDMRSAVVEKLLGAKSVETAIQIQTDYAKSAYEGFVAQATKINEMYVKLASEAFKPVETALAAVQGK